ncbi:MULTISPECIES: hydrogenase maturation protease [Lysinibacillus]|uniref:Hydrogenase maturation protease n=1 Tax=Lysinibacillus antri TaxID=2498145 RepID=A0A3S0QNA6_9BACI|nr:MULTISPECIES: hydrogenase maturation protease [Lysinibacillus]RUL48641.1 hydrogenase maturation protease [Lysinibacillus antri]TSI09700.1 hydrogenase maturation protease [Lysinibacillus sp. BW-2-10]
MKEILVLGIGNRLMMDDGIGIYLVEELMKQETEYDIQYIVGESDVDYCIQQIENAKSVIIIDATISDNQPGEITIYPLDHLAAFHSLDFSLHNLHLFQVLYQLKDHIQGYLIGIEAYEITFNLGLSEIIESRWDHIVKNVKDLIEKLINQAR